MLKEDFKNIIEAANRAPSGSNSQPWKFIVKDNLIKIIATPEKDHPIFNFRNRGTYIAHGALVENLIIASYKFGYQPSIKIFPYPEDPNITAEILLTKSEPKDHELYEAIFKRCSNRKIYQTKKLDTKIKNYLFENTDFKNCKLSITEDNSQIEKIAQLLAFDIVLNLGNKTLHEALFREIIWKEDEQKNRGGLYVKTMEIPGPAILILKILSNWRINTILKKIHFKIYQENVKTLKSTGLFGAIAVADDDKNFFESGRLMQNIWLKATKLDLNFHLITGIPFLWQQANFGKKEIFSVEEINLINRLYNDLTDLFNIDKNKEIIALTFRIGYGDKPSAISYKREPIIEFQ